GNSIPAGGRCGVFQSLATNLVAGGTSSRQVFVRDRDADENGILDEAGPGKQTTELVSKTAGGVMGNGSSSEASLSADGGYIAFVKTNTHLPPGVGPTCPNGLGGALSGCVNVVLKDRQTGAVVTISAENAMTAGNGDSRRPAITPNGRFVVFESTASNLVPGDTNNTCNNDGDGD